MFDIDGTLLESVDFDEVAFIDAVKTVTGREIDSDWESYPHVSDTGLIQTFCEQHNLLDTFDEVHHKVKQAFISNIKAHLDNQPVQAIPGAQAFIGYLTSQPNYLVSYATGGWRESALMKLQSASIDIDAQYLKSSNDDYRRTHIMRAAKRASRVIYLGDGLWDQVACAKLAYPFIAVGDKVDHPYRITDFSEPEKVLALIDASV